MTAEEQEGGYEWLQIKAWCHIRDSPVRGSYLMVGRSRGVKPRLGPRSVIYQGHDLRSGLGFTCAVGARTWGGVNQRPDLVKLGYK